jgi:hypothetical protein
MTRICSIGRKITLDGFALCTGTLKSWSLERRHRPFGISEKTSATVDARLTGHQPRPSPPRTLNPKGEGQRSRGNQAAAQAAVHQVDSDRPDLDDHLVSVRRVERAAARGAEPPAAWTVDRSPEPGELAWNRLSVALVVGILRIAAGA